ncbi:MAG: hypothetical protein HC896_06350 [Bacteroidales bacterium]|nr:hypothetical protein [Bacteroidales bacterium]
MEYAAKLPPEYKLKGLKEKFILKELIKGRIPASIVNRPKQAYRAPIAPSFLGKGAPEYVQELLSEKILSDYGIFNPATVVPLIEKIKKSDRPTELENMTLAGVLSAQLLVHQYIKNQTEGLDLKTISDPKVINESTLN